MTSMSVRFGVFVPQGWRMDLTEISDPVEKYEAMTRVAKAVDAIPGYDSIWVFDHFHTVPVPVQETCFEAWTITAALSRDTQRVNVGQMVTCVGYRNPALLAKMASTVDVMSHGRLFCGIGGGWYEHEWKAYGYGFPETKDRMRNFREATEIIYKMFTEEEPVYHGQRYSIERPINEPRGARKPHTSLWIGGGGEQVTLKLVAKYGDACNFNSDPATMRHKYEVLREHCEAVGRDYDEIIRSTDINIFPLRAGEDPETATAKARAPLGMSLENLRNVSLVGDSEELIAYIQSLVDAGANYVVVTLPRLAYDLEPLHRFAEEVIPHFS